MFFIIAIILYILKSIVMEKLALKSVKNRLNLPICKGNQGSKKQTFDAVTDDSTLPFSLTFICHWYFFDPSWSNTGPTGAYGPLNKDSKEYFKDSKEFYL